MNVSRSAASGANRKTIQFRFRSSCISSGFFVPYVNPFDTAFFNGYI
jgi:hypothetical protein